MGDVDRMEHVGGQPAIDFVNTLGGLPDDPDDEYLVRYCDLVAFVESSGLLDPETSDRLRESAEREPDLGAETLIRALRLRACLDRVLRARLDDLSPAEQDLDSLVRAYAAALAHAAMEPAGGNYGWVWSGAGDDLDRPLWVLASQAIDLLRSAPLHRLSRCGRCRWLFLDTSRNHSRRWCSMNGCGSVMKMRRYRAARR